MGNGTITLGSSKTTTVAQGTSDAAIAVNSAAKPQNPGTISKGSPPPAVTQHPTGAVTPAATTTSDTTVPTAPTPAATADASTTSNSTTSDADASAAEQTIAKLAAGE